MSTISLKSLLKKKPAIDSLTLLSFDMDIYLVELDIGGQSVRVVDDDGKPMAWRSQLLAKKPFKGLGIKRSRLRHESTYDEMIGMPPKGGEMEVSIQNPDDDPS